jgi:hypothetical protein
MFWRQRSEAEARAAWLDAAALLEARSRADFKHVQDAHAALVDTLGELRADLLQRDEQLTTTLTQLGTVCQTLSEHMEADRQERRELVETINSLASALIERSGAPAGHLVGGSVFGSTGNEVPAPATIDLTAVEVGAEGRDTAHVASSAPGPGDEVRCRFGDRWVEGFEVLEVHSREGRARYRVRRRSDGSVVRKLFEANDLEAVGAPKATSTS